MNKPQISVIVPCYNHSPFIVEALESVLNQTFTNFECIIINDGSTDNTEEVVLEWIKKNEKFKYFHQVNSGLSSARNKGISLSSGVFILPLDSDDKISENYLEACYKVLNGNSAVKIAYGAARFFGNVNKKWNLDTYNFEDILYKNMIYCSGLYRKADWEITGGYDENMKEGLEDWEFWIHILKNGGEVVQTDRCCFYYRLKDVSMITEQVVKNHYGYNSRVYIFEKHIELYRKTNFYDMYFENYKLKKALGNPLLHFKLNDLFSLTIRKIVLNFRNGILKIRNKFLKKM